MCWGGTFQDYNANWLYDTYDFLNTLILSITEANDTLIYIYQLIIQKFVHIFHEDSRENHAPNHRVKGLVRRTSFLFDSVCCCCCCCCCCRCCCFGKKRGWWCHVELSQLPGVLLSQLKKNPLGWSPEIPTYLIPTSEHIQNQRYTSSLHFISVLLKCKDFIEADPKLEWMMNLQ